MTAKESAIESMKEEGVSFWHYYNRRSNLIPKGDIAYSYDIIMLNGEYIYVI